MLSRTTETATFPVFFNSGNQYLQEIRNKKWKIISAFSQNLCQTRLNLGRISNDHINLTLEPTNTLTECTNAVTFT